MYEKETKRIRKTRGINNACFHLSTFDGVFPIRGHIHLIMALHTHTHTHTQTVCDESVGFGLAVLMWFSGGRKAWFLVIKCCTLQENEICNIKQKENVFCYLEIFSSVHWTIMKVIALVVIQVLLVYCFVKTMNLDMLCSHPVFCLLYS